MGECLHGAVVQTRDKNGHLVQIYICPTCGKSFTEPQPVRFC